MTDINKQSEELLNRIRDVSFEVDLGTVTARILNIEGMLDAIMDAQARIISKLENVDANTVLEQMALDANKYTVQRFERLAGK